MNKVIISLLCIVGFSFSAVTGMLVDSGSGVFLSARVMNIDSDVNDLIDPAFGISFGHIMDSGLEFALTYMVEHGSWDDYNPMNLTVDYHINDNMFFGLNLMDFTDDSDLGWDYKTIHAAYHTETNAFINLDYNLDVEEDEISLEFGKLFKMNDTITFGASYAANASDLDLGFIFVTIGSTF